MPYAPVAVPFWCSLSLHLGHAQVIPRLCLEHCSPTCSRAIFGTVGPACGLCEAQLPAEDMGSLQCEVIIADGAPFTSSLYLHAALIGFPGEASQPEPQSLASCLLLRARGRRRRPQAQAAHEAQQQAPWAPQPDADRSHGRKCLDTPERVCKAQSQREEGGVAGKEIPLVIERWKPSLNEGRDTQSKRDTDWGGGRGSLSLLEIIKLVISSYNPHVVT